MFSNLFTSSPSVWLGLIAGLVALPILIHLINLVRHKNIEWAAMEFLLKSYRKNRNWVWLKQMLLLLSRIAILLLGLFLLSQAGCENDRIAALLGSRSTHHYVLIDDSYSMSDRDNQSSAMDRARTTAMQVVNRARSRSNHRFSLLKYSAFDPSEASSSLIPRFDIENELVDSAFVKRAETAVTSMDVSSFSETCERSLQSITELVQSRDQENAIVYLLSDFREKDWQQNSSIAGSLNILQDAGAAVELVRCTKTMHANLSVTELKPVGNVRVAETPLMMQVTVRNNSDEVRRKIQVKVNSTVYGQQPGEKEATAAQEELPTVFIESIEPGKEESRTFPVWFGEPGKHSVSASIDEDAVAADNVRECIVNIETNADVLIVDQPNRLHADFLSLALNPNRMTGIRAEVRTPEFLRNVTADSFARFDLLCICDVGQLEEASIRNIKQYVSAGGGLVYFGGPNTNVAWFNRTLYEDGSGLMPVELSDSWEVDEREDSMPADIVPERHPVFAPVNDVTNSLLDLVQIRKVLRPSFDWLQSPPDQSTVIATVRGDRQMPLLIEGRYGDGRTMMFMTTAGPQWNNWMRNATFPPILLLLEDYLANGKYKQDVSFVGQSVAIEKPTGSVTPEVVLYSPTDSDERIESKIRLTQTASGLIGWLGESEASRVNRGTSVPGVYEMWFREMDSSSSVDRVALNVDPDEGDLALVSDEKLLRNFGKATTLTEWDQFNPEPEQKAISSLNRVFLVLLVLMLVFEQALAWSCSYH